MVQYLLLRRRLTRFYYLVGTRRYLKFSFSEKCLDLSALRFCKYHSVITFFHYMYVILILLFLSASLFDLRNKH